MTAVAHASTSAKDPVCGMLVDPATAKHKAEHLGANYYFCSAGCRAKFVAEPARFLAAAAREACARGRDLHLPDASRDPSARPGPLPDLRHGAGAGSCVGRRGPERGAHRYDPALLGRARALGSGLCARNGRTSDPSAHACARRGFQLAPVGAFNAGRAVGRLAVLRARLCVAQDPQPQHVHPDRHGRRRGLDL